MDASKITRPDPLITTALSTRTKSVESNEPTIETRPDNDQDGSRNISNGSVNLSDTSLKLSTSSPVKSSDRSAPIENKDQAQQALNQLIADFQNNPSQAQGVHGNIFAGAVKSLLG